MERRSPEPQGSKDQTIWLIVAAMHRDCSVVIEVQRI